MIVYTHIVRFVFKFPFVKRLAMMDVIFGVLLLALITISNVKGQESYKTMGELSWDDAVRHCTLATPEITYTSGGPIVNTDPLDSLSLYNDDTAWVGYIQSYRVFQYIGCVKIQTIHKYFTVNVEDIRKKVESDPGQCFSACNTTTFGIGYYGSPYSSTCYCFNERPQYDWSEGVQPHCNKYCANPLNTACGGEDRDIYYVSLYEKVSNKPSSQYNTSFCKAVMLTSISQHYEWRKCFDPNLSQCRTNNNNINKISTGSIDWFQSMNYCFDQEKYPVSYGDLKNVTFDGRSSFYWTGMLRAPAIFKLNDSRNSKSFSKVGYVKSSVNGGVRSYRLHFTTIKDNTPRASICYREEKGKSTEKSTDVIKVSSTSSLTTSTETRDDPTTTSAQTTTMPVQTNTTPAQTTTTPAQTNTTSAKTTTTSAKTTTTSAQTTTTSAKTTTTSAQTTTTPAQTTTMSAQTNITSAQTTMTSADTTTTYINETRTDKNVTNDDGKSVVLLPVILAAVGLILLVVILVSVVCICRKRRKQTEYNHQNVKNTQPPSDYEMAYATSNQPNEARNHNDGLNYVDVNAADNTYAEASETTPEIQPDDTYNHTNTQFQQKTVHSDNFDTYNHLGAINKTSPSEANTYDTTNAKTAITKDDGQHLLYNTKTSEVENEYNTTETTFSKHYNKQLATENVYNTLENETDDTYSHTNANVNKKDESVEYDVCSNNQRQ